MLRTALFASLILVGLPAAAPAAAEDAPRITVPHDDLDLTRPADRKKLERRVRRAVTTLCPGQGFELRVHFDILRCRQVAAAGAKKQVREAVAGAAGTSSPARFAGVQQGGRS
jgi:UrcA family protein